MRVISRFKPKLIVGYSYNLYVLADYILNNHIDGIQPKAVISTANMLLDSHRKTIESAFHCKVFNRYGSRELGCIASECSEHTGLHINMENVFVEFEKLTASDRNGRLFNLICTSMGNCGMPFIRYEIGDLGIPSSEPCACGRGLPMIKELKGRTYDILRTPSGKIITGNVFGIVFSDHSHVVKQFQIRQRRLDQMEVTVAVKPGVKQEDLHNLMSLIRVIIGPDVEVTFNITEEIPLSASGKLHLTISEI
jgi:phenylacetate-CoA ligase